MTKKQNLKNVQTNTPAIMAYQTKNIYDAETHPWEPYIPNKADKLLLGTFPTHIRNRKNFEFFYPNPNNDFWKIIFEAAEIKQEEYLQSEPVAIRKQALDQLGLGIADICKAVYRQKNSSSDNALFPLEFTDIFLLLEKHPNITTIVVTSSSKRNSTLAYLNQYCSMNGYPFKIPEGTLPKTVFFTFQNKTIKIEIVPSTSRQSRTDRTERLEMYKKALQRD